MLETFLLHKSNYSGLHRIQKFGIEILETNRKSWVGNFANRCGIPKNLYWCRTFLWKREFVHLCSNAKSKVYLDHFGRDWLRRSGWTIGDPSAEHVSIFLRRGRSTTFHFHQKKPATCGCSPAGSKTENGIFSRREADQAELFLVQLVATARTETVENKSQKRKESPMEGSPGEAADRKYRKTESGSNKAKYFAFLNEERSCSADNSSVRRRSIRQSTTDGGQVVEWVKVWTQRLSITGVDGTVPQISRNCNNSLKISQRTCDFTR